MIRRPPRSTLFPTRRSSDLKMFKYGVVAGTQLEDMKRSLSIDELDRKLLTATVSHIYIYEDKKIDIEFRFCNILDKLQVNQT